MKVKIDNIVIPKDRARSSWTDEQKAMLDASFGKYGQLSDPLVRELKDGKYELLDGESRVAQFKEAGLEEIEVKIVDLSDKDSHIVNLLMNMARGTQDPMGACLALNQAQDAGMSLEEMAGASGHSREWVQFILMLKDLPDIYKKALERGDLLIGHIRQAFRLPNPKEIDACLSVALRQKLKVNVIQNYVNNRLAEFEAARAMKEDYGIEAPPPAIDAKRLSQNIQCLACLQMVDKNDVHLPRICTACYNMLKYVTSQVGTGNEAMQKIFDALRLQEISQRRAEDFMLRTQAYPQVQPEPIPQPQQEPPNPQDLDMMVKPEGMSNEEWGKLKANLKRVYSG